MMKHIRTFILLMTSIAMSHSTMARYQSHAGGSVPGCNSHGNANIHNPHCRGQVQPIVPVTDHTTGSVSTSQQTVDQLKPPQPANITVSPMPSGQPLIGYGKLDIKPLPPQVITGYGPVGSKTGNKAVGQQKYITPPKPQPVIAPPQPQPVVVPSTALVVIEPPKPQPRPVVAPPTPNVVVNPQLSPSFTEVGKIPVLPPQVITGYGPVGSKTGNKAVGQQKYVTPPKPQPVIAPPKPQPVVVPSTALVVIEPPKPQPRPVVAPPTPNVVVNPKPSSSFTGVGKIPVLPPQVITGYGPVGSKTGNKVVGQQKYVTPPKPQPVIAPPQPVVVVAGTYGPHFSGTSPVKIPDVTTTKLNKPAGNKQHQTPLPIYVNSKAGKVLVGYGTSQNSVSHKVVVHHQTLQGGDKHKDHVSPKAANNLVVGFRSTHQDAEGTVWTCALSGLQRRLVLNDEGQVALSGDPETFHFRDPHTAHLPSNHRFESDCAVVINKQL